MQAILTDRPIFFELDQATFGVQPTRKTDELARSPHLTMENRNVPSGFLPSGFLPSAAPKLTIVARFVTQKNKQAPFPKAAKPETPRALATLSLGRS